MPCALAMFALMPVAGASASSNSAFGWGDRYAGAIGDGTEIETLCVSKTNQCAPVPVAVSNIGESSGNSAVAMAGGDWSSIALLSNGTVMTWGSPTGIKTPQLVSGLSEVTAIAAARFSDLALLRNGTVMAWGRNEQGELGDGTTEASATPVEVQGLHEVVAIAARDQHCLAVLRDGKVMAWGRNNFGQLGDGARQNSDVPVEVIASDGKPLSGATEVSAGGFGEDTEHSLALLRDGTVWAWGDGEYGQLGDGKKRPHRDRAGQVKGLDGTVTEISAGGRHSLALLSSGRVMAWGWNGRDELGDGIPGTTVERTALPVEVSGLEDVTEISAGESFSLALLGNGTVMSWGWNFYDELGNEPLIDEQLLAAPGEAAASDVPVQVSHLSNVVGVAATTLHAFAFGPADALE